MSISDKFLSFYNSNKIIVWIAFSIIMIIIALEILRFNNINGPNGGQNPSVSTSTVMANIVSSISTSTSTATATPIPKVPHPITGELIEQSEYDRLTKLTMIPLIIENHPDARPQSGLSQAEAVYEYVAEGGITRYLAVFLSAEPTRLGPIRSLRTYFAASGAEYQGSVEHWGFTAAQPKGGYSYGFDSDLIDVPYFVNHYGIIHNECEGYRDPVLVRQVAYEHTLFNTLKALRLCSGNIEWNSKFVKYKFTDTPDITSQVGATKINLSIVKQTPQFAVEWDYDVASKKYLRKLAGVADIDFNTKSQIAVKNLIIMKVPMSYSGNTLENDVLYDLVGEGKASYIHDGISQEVTWKKDSWTARTLFFDPVTKAEIKFDTGNFWYEMMGISAGTAGTNGSGVIGDLVVL